MQRTPLSILETEISTKIKMHARPWADPPPCSLRIVHVTWHQRSRLSDRCIGHAESLFLFPIVLDVMLYPIVPLEKNQDGINGKVKKSHA